jgi:hypothetical protein
MTWVAVCLTVMLALASGCARNGPAQASTSPPVQTRIIPAGSELIIRTVEPVDTTRVMEGKSWAAVLSRDVRTPEGDLIVGAGSPIYFGVVETQAGLQLVIRSVMASGNSYIVSSPVTASAAPVTALDPWGNATGEIHLTGSRITVPGQALLALRTAEAIALRRPDSATPVPLDR